MILGVETQVCIELLFENIGKLVIGCTLYTTDTTFSQESIEKPGGDDYDRNYMALLIS